MSTGPGQRRAAGGGDVGAVGAVHGGPHRCAGRHDVAPAVVACVLGSRFGPLLTHASGPGAPGAAAPHPTMSLPLGAAHRGDL